MRLEQVKEDLQALLLVHAGRTALYLSGGADSLLLLHILMDMRAQFACVSFDNLYTREQRLQLEEIINEFELRVFTYRPVNAYMIGDGKDRVSLVEEYRMPDGHVMPFIRDLSHDEAECFCDLNVPLAPNDATVSGGLTLQLFGTRKFDRHYATGRPFRERTWTQGLSVYYAPLWDWTRKHVLEGLAHYEADKPKLDTADMPMCLNCLTAKETAVCPKRGGDMIPRYGWNPQQMTTDFRQKYGFV